MATSILAPPLPSATSAFGLVHGDPSALPLVLLHTAARAAIIYAGLYVAGERKRLRTAVVASLAIETFVLAFMAYQPKAPGAT